MAASRRTRHKSRSTVKKKKKPAKFTTRGPLSPRIGGKRQKLYLPIKGYGRLNAFQVLDALYGHSAAELKQLLQFEEIHQKRRMVIDRINDILRRIKS